MAQHGQVLNFRRYRIDQLIDTADQLHIPLSLQDLKKCELHYRKIEKRDPYIEELRLFASLQKANRRNFAISEFVTDNPEWMRSFLDLMKKAKVLFPSSERPWHISELASVVDASLKCLGAEKKSDFFPLFRLDPISQMPIDFFPFPKNSVAEVGDRVLLIDRSDNLFDTVKHFCRHPLSKGIKNGVSCSCAGIMQDILSICDAIHLDVSKLGDVEKVSFSEILLTPHPGKILFRTDAGSCDEITALLESEGCTVTLIGVVPKKNRISLYVDRDTCFSMDTDFLASFSGSYERSISLSGTSSPKDTSIEGEYQRRDDREICFQASTDNCDVSLGVSLQYLSAVTALALSGVRPENAVVFPFFGADTPERTTEALLTAYRFQSELSIAGTPVFLPNPCKNAVLFAKAKGNAVPACEPLGCDTHLYFLDLTGFSESEFDPLRKALHVIAEHAEKGCLLSATLFKEDFLSHKIHQFCSNGVQFYPCDNSLLYGRNVKLGLLMESVFSLPFPVIGYLKKP